MEAVYLGSMNSHAVPSKAAASASAMPRPIPTDATPGALSSSYQCLQTASQYHASKWAQSCSMLKPCLTSPAHYLQALVSRPAASPALDYGTLLHTAVLEPHRLQEVAAVFTGDPADRRSIRLFREANPERIVLGLAAYLNLLTAASRVLDSLFRGRPFGLFVEEGIVERSLFYLDPHTDMWCRVRPDLWHPDFSFDLKSTRHATALAFQRHALDLHYDMQAYMYSLARCLFDGNEDAKPFVLVQVESEAPHGVLWRPAGHEFLENGKRKYETALDRLQACSATDSWSRPEGEEPLALEPWHQFSG